VSIIYGSMAIVNTCVVFRQQKTPELLGLGFVILLF
jgi:hypothetical protein